MPTEEIRHGWLDLKVNVQSLLTATVGTVVGVAVAWYSLVGRVSTLEEHDRQHTQHFARIESDMQQQRADVKDQLRSIGSDVKDTNQKLDQLTQQLLLSTAGNRPDTRRWAK
ncbi:hypothetical protein [Burkholderia multivorans]|uniref:hypothetical protein n=1 Tax=Burkholderia multivorans TaxID=87883 RepID=UPI001591BF8B|nr:hypothetical protein [Burkholderia multivorans]MCA8339611.1 hypothetical protein [Burkholderia multivorans]